MKRRYPPHIRFAICERFLQPEGGADNGQSKMAALLQWCKEQPWYDAEKYPLNPPIIYQLVREGVADGYVVLRPPRKERLEEVFGARYGLPGQVKIVDVAAPTVLRHLSGTAAHLILELIREVYAAKKATHKGGEAPRVHLGFGAGGTARRVAQALATELRYATGLPPLTIHALTSGFDVHRTLDAPVAFFSYFEDLTPPVQTIGLYSAPVVDCDRFPDTLKEHGVKESLASVRDIDIVVTSLARGADPHGLLTRFLRLYEDAQVSLRRQGHVGDVLMQAYSDEGPLPLTHGIRAVTLFDLEGLVRLASTEGKHVVLVAGPCGGCGEYKDEALHPLLTVPSLRVCNHLVTDATTAQAVWDYPDHRAGR